MLVSVSPTVSEYLATSLNEGTIYEYQVRPRNVHGESSPSLSNTLVYQASQAPDKPAAVTTTVETNVNVKIAWVAPDSNHKPITDYQILIGDHNAVNFIETKSLCDGSRSQVMSVNYCIIPISALRNAPYNLVRLELIKAKIRAKNIRGWSDYSDVNTVGVTVKTEPDQMAAPSNGPLTDEYRIDVFWTALTTPDDGDSAITSYNLDYDNGTGGFMWYSLVGLIPDRLGLTYRITTGVVPGRVYRFRVRAKNSFGWGDYSPYTTIKTAVKPYQMLSPVTTIDSVTGNVRISWYKPADGSDDITSYTIEIMYKGQNIGEPSATYCDGT